MQSNKCGKQGLLLTRETKRIDKVEIIELRPHHGMCIGQFIGKGYSEEFVINMRNIINRLESAKDIKIRLVCHTDSICKSCPHNENSICNSGQKVLSYDNSCLHICGLSENDEITWEEFKRHVKESIILQNKIREVCINCSWIDVCVEHAGINYSSY
jgi:uncharacterized protein